LAVLHLFLSFSSSSFSSSSSSSSSSFSQGVRPDSDCAVCVQQTDPNLAADRLPHTFHTMVACLPAWVSVCLDGWMDGCSSLLKDVYHALEPPMYQHRQAASALGGSVHSAQASVICTYNIGASYMQQGAVGLWGLMKTISS
jgi:hypothetical protein